MGKKNSIKIHSIEKDVSMGETVIYATIGKYECTLVAVNKPSEEAIMNFRKELTKVVKRIVSEEKNKELGLVNRKDNV